MCVELAAVSEGGAVADLAAAAAIASASWAIELGWSITSSGVPAWAAGSSKASRSGWSLDTAPGEQPLPVVIEDTGEVLACANVRPDP